MYNFWINERFLSSLFLSPSILCFLQPETRTIFRTFYNHSLRIFFCLKSVYSQKVYTHAGAIYAFVLYFIFHALLHRYTFFFLQVQEEKVKTKKINILMIIKHTCYRALCVYNPFLLSAMKNNSRIYVM